MNLLIYIVLVVILVSCMYAKASAEDKKDTYIAYKKQGLELLREYNTCVHYNGFKEYGKLSIPEVLLFTDRIRFNLSSNNTREILIKDISDCRVQTDVQISERISKGKLLAFGIFALGMKKKQEEICKSYVLLSCKYKGEDTDFVFDFKDFNTSFVTIVNNNIDKIKANNGN